MSVKLKGLISVHPDGYAFVKIEGKPQDYFVKAGDSLGAFTGDLVEVQPLVGGREGRTRAKVTAILVPGKSELVAVVRRYGPTQVAMPREGRAGLPLVLPRGQEGGASPGDLVLVRIDRDSRSGPRGRVVEVLGRPGDRDAELQAVIRAHGLSRAFPPAVEAEARAKAAGVPRQPDGPRRDLRSERIFTIDGPDAKDFDDAVSLRFLDHGRARLGVHIADVSSYVKEGTALDKEAEARGTSVYLPGLVIPMLPAALSDDACSLVPNQDRLTLTCEMDLDRAGNVLHTSVFPSVIRSVQRGVYEEVQDVLDGKNVPGYGPIRRDIQEMASLARAREKLRRARGSLDFNFPEAKVELDENGKVLALARRDRMESHRLIEELMLVANESVARHLSDLAEPCMYRIHETPDEDKLVEANAVLETLGLAIRDPRKVHPRDIQALLTAVKGKPEETSVSTLLLRSLKQARYSPLRGLHFGLATEYYAHFTSPIRRYPDLVVHRILHESLPGHLSPARRGHFIQWLPKASEHASARERVAQETEREAVALKQAEFMADKVGQEFEAQVSGTTSFGFFVQLKEHYVEGLVHGSAVPGGWPPGDLAPYAVGAAVKVKVAKVDVELRRIDFTVAGQPVPPGSRHLQRSHEGRESRHQGRKSGGGARHASAGRSHPQGQRHRKGGQAPGGGGRGQGRKSKKNRRHRRP